MREVSIDFLQQQVRTIWAESREVRVFLWEGHVPPPEENADLLGFHPERAHLLLQEVYGDFLHHNDG